MLHLALPLFAHPGWEFAQSIPAAVRAADERRSNMDIRDTRLKTVRGGPVIFYVIVLGGTPAEVQASLSRPASTGRQQSICPPASTCGAGPDPMGHSRTATGSSARGSPVREQPRACEQARPWSRSRPAPAANTAAASPCRSTDEGGDRADRR